MPEVDEESLAHDIGAVLACDEELLRSNRHIASKWSLQLSYITGAIVDDIEIAKQSLESLYELIGELMVGYEVVDSEESAIVACEKILQVLQKASEGVEFSPDIDVEPKKLESSVVMAKNANAASAAVAAELDKLIGGEVKINSNTEITASFYDVPEHESEESMLHRIRMQKKTKRLERKAMNKERNAAPIRNALIEQLTREVAVIHNMQGEDGSYGGNPAVDIVLKDISIDLGGMVLLNDTDLTIVYRRRYGLIGANGSGKSTFLKFLASKIWPGVPWYIQILHIQQEIPGGDRSALQTVLDTDVERTALLKELAKLEGDDDAEESMTDAKTSGDQTEGKNSVGEDLLTTSTVRTAPNVAGDELLTAMGIVQLNEEVDHTERIADIYDRLDEIEANTAESRASIILSGLSFTKEMMNTPTRELSGGWRMRVSLARALFIEPDLLLLDEPTNHLDLHAVVWLENYLRNYEKTVIVVSHARGFLNEVVTDILELEKKEITRYKGDYDTYEATKSASMLRDTKAKEASDKARTTIQAQINKNIGSGAKGANMAKSRQKMLDKMDHYDAITPVSRHVNFNIPNPGPVAGGWGIRLVGVGFAYPDRPTLFDGVEFSINQTSRIVLVGPNGIGKSTLLNVIYQELEPTTGMITQNARLRVARFSQHQVDTLTMKQSVLEIMQKKYPSDPPPKIRKHLGGMGVTGELQVRPVYTMSGGQKSRVALAMLTYDEPHMLLLDEPTNHLDLDTVQGLIKALANYEGGVFVVSHDEHLISAVCNELWVIKDKKVHQSHGNFQEYKARVAAEFLAKNRNGVPQVVTSSGV